MQCGPKYRCDLMVFRTEQLLELYEAAPDDDNNWGDIVELADNLGKILDHSDSNDSEDAKDKKKEKKKAGKQGGNAVRAKTARLQSAIIARHNEKLQSEISTVLNSSKRAELMIFVVLAKLLCFNLKNMYC